MRKNGIENNPVLSSIKESHVTLKANEAPTPGGKPKKSESFKKSRLSDLRRMMDRETKKISEDDIRGTDIPTEYLVGFAFLVIAVAGVFIFY